MSNERELGNAIFWSGPHAILVNVPADLLADYQSQLAGQPSITVPIHDHSDGRRKTVQVEKLWIVGEPPICE